MIPEGFKRVGKELRCPICQRNDWCLMAMDGSRAVCARIPSPNRWGDAGWLHLLDAAALPLPRWKPPRKPRQTRPGSTIEEGLDEMIRQMIGGVADHMLNHLSVELGVTPQSLRRLSIGWCSGQRAWAFPMSDAHAHWIGVRLRSDTGRKWAIAGSKSGLFLPDRWKLSGPLLIVEGPTDAAAALDWGFDVLGRPSCNDGGEMIHAILKRHRRDVVILSNLDEPKHRPDGSVFYPGQQGAEALANRIHWACNTLKVIFPPPGMGKDARTWLNRGGEREDVRNVIAIRRQWRRTA